MSIRPIYVCALAAWSLAQPALAADSGWYFGASAGSLSSDIGLAQATAVRDSALFIDRLAAGPAGDSSLDDSSETWSVLAGYRLSPNLSVEAAYVDLGEATYDYRGELSFGSFPNPFPTVPTALFPESSHIEWDNSAIAVKLVGRLPLTERFDVHAQVGGAMVRTDVTSSAFIGAVSPAEYALDEDSTSTGLTYGAGAAVRLGSRWSLSMDLQRYEVGEDSDTPLDLDASYDALTLSVFFDLNASD